MDCLKAASGAALTFWGQRQSPGILLQEFQLKTIRTKDYLNPVRYICFSPIG
jgi:hypothetical protein